MPEDTLALQLAIAGAVAHFIQALKRSNLFGLRWIHDEAEFASKLVSTIFAALVSLGIGVAWNIDPATQTGSLHVSGLPITMQGWADVFGHGFVQYWFQKGYYLTAIKPNVRDTKVDAALGITDTREPEENP